MSNPKRSSDWENHLVKKYCKEVCVLLERLDVTSMSSLSSRSNSKASTAVESTSSEPPSKKQRVDDKSFPCDFWHHKRTFSIFNIPFCKLRLEEEDFEWSGEIPFGIPQEKVEMVQAGQSTQYSLITSDEESSNQSSLSSVSDHNRPLVAKKGSPKKLIVSSISAGRTKEKFDYLNPKQRQLIKPIGCAKFYGKEKAALSAKKHNILDAANFSRSKINSKPNKSATACSSSAFNGISKIKSANQNKVLKKADIEQKLQPSTSVSKELRLYSIPKKDSLKDSSKKQNPLPPHILEKLRKELKEKNKNLAVNNHAKSPKDSKLKRKLDAKSNNKDDQQSSAKSKNAVPNGHNSNTKPNKDLMPKAAAITKRQNIVNNYYYKSPLEKIHHYSCDNWTKAEMLLDSLNNEEHEKEGAAVKKLKNKMKCEDEKASAAPILERKMSFKRHSSKDSGQTGNLDNIEAIFSPISSDPIKSILKVDSGSKKDKCVMFQDDKNQIFDIPKVSKKHSSHSTSFFDSTLKQQCSNLTLLEQVIFCILRWNPVWFQEYRGDMNFLPPIFDDSIKINKEGRVQATFNNYKEYADVMKPLVICEIWENAYYFHKTFTRNQKPITGVVWPAKDATAVEVFQDYNIRAAVLRGFDEFQQDSLVEFSFGDLSLNQNCFLGIITSFSSQPIRSFNEICSNLREYVPAEKASEYKVISFLIRAKAKSNIPRNYHGVLNVKGICNVVRYLRIVETLMYLKTFKLCKDVLHAEAKHFSLESDNESSQKIHDDVLVCANDLLKPGSQIFSFKLSAYDHHANYIVDLIELIQKTKPDRSKDSSAPRETVLICCSNYHVLDAISRALVNRIRAYRTNDPDRKFVNFVRVGEQMADDIQPYSLDSIASRNLNMASNNDEENAAVVETTSVTAAELQMTISHTKGQLAHFETLTVEEAEEAPVLEAKLQELEKKLKKCKDKRISKSLMYRQKRNIIFHADVIAVSLQDCCSQPLCSTLLDDRKALRVLCTIVDDAQASLELETLIPLGFGVEKLILFGSSAPEARQLCIKSELARSLEFGSFFNRLQQKRLADKERSKDS